MEIKDNGIGFEVGSLTPTDSRIRLGLLGMRERVEMVEGTFAVTSALGKQTTVRVTIPVGSSSPQPKPSRRTKADS
jgi:signal transduction histidine kinase